MAMMYENNNNNWPPSPIRPPCSRDCSDCRSASCSSVIGNPNSLRVHRCFGVSNPLRFLLCASPFLYSSTPTSQLSLYAPVSSSSLVSTFESARMAAYAAFSRC